MIRTLLFLIFPLCCFGQNRLVPANYNLDSSIETYSVIEDQGITVFAECLEARKDLMIFDIEIQNKSGKELHFNPQEMYYYQSDAPFPADEFWENHYSVQTEVSHKRFAQSENDVQEYYIRKIRSKENTKTILAILGTALLVYDAAKDGQDFHREPTFRRVNRSIARDITLVATLTGIDIAGDKLTNDQLNSDEDLYYLSEEYLLETSLHDEGSIRGKVYFFKDFQFTFYRLIVPVGDREYAFDFRWPTYEEKRLLKRTK